MDRVFALTLMKFLWFNPFSFGVWRRGCCLLRIQVSKIVCDWSVGVVRESTSKGVSSRYGFFILALSFCFSLISSFFCFLLNISILDFFCFYSFIVQAPCLYLSHQSVLIHPSNLNERASPLINQKYWNSFVY